MPDEWRRTVGLLGLALCLALLVLLLAGSLGPALAQTTSDSLATTYKQKLCEIYSTGRQLVYVALGIGILVVVVLSIGSRFRTGLFLTLVASVVIVATTDQLLKFLSPEATVCDTRLAELLVPVPAAPR